MIRYYTIPPRRSDGVIINKGESWKILAASSAHGDRVKFTPQNRFGEEYLYLIENLNDSPVTIQIQPNSQ